MAVVFKSNVGHASVVVDFNRKDDLFLAQIAAAYQLRMKTAMEMLKVQTQRNISISSRAVGPSKPGEFPHANTGRLRNSLFWDVSAIRDVMQGRMGTPLKYGLWLELGTSGGAVIVPRRGTVLSWVGRDGQRRFAKKVIQGPIRPRPYLSRTLREMKPKLQSVFTRKM